MRILVTGATGLIGSAIVARLESLGHDVISATRSGGGSGSGRRVALDFATAGEADWLAALAGVETVVNAAGVLQDGPGDSTSAVHDDGAGRLFAACEEAGVKRFIQISALGVDREASTEFLKSKLRGDDRLMASALDWVVLRPSVVLGRAAYGGSALIRALAALPVLPIMPNTGLLQVVQLDDVVETVVFFLKPDAPSRQIMELAGSERLGFADVVSAYRRWLGWKPQPSFAVPAFAAALVFRAGDLVGLLGWRAPIRTTARIEVARGSVGDNSRWRAVTGIRPRSLAEALAAVPASVQERWFARMYFVKPLVFGMLALFWIATGLISLGPGWQQGMGTMREAGVSGIGPALVAGGAVADILIGLGIMARRTSRMALYAAIAISACYAVAGTLLLPRLWLDPLAPLLKILPITALAIVALAIREDR